MTEMRCEEIREVIPDYVTGPPEGDRPRAFEEHMAACADCAGEFALARLLFSGRGAAPADLRDRVVTAIRRRPSRSARPWWGLSAAAVAALVVGLGVASDRGPLGVGSGLALGLGSEFEEGELWLSDDGLLAGAPEFGALSDEALVELLEELTSEIGGGSGGVA
jgi:predicted anti-sigma-YlaC factor YlaD